MKHKLLYLTGDLRGGGLQRQLFYLLKYLDRERYRPAVAVWSYQHNDHYVGKIRNLGIPLYAMPRFASWPKKMIALRKLVREVKPEVVHSYSFYTNIAAQYASLGSHALSIGSIRSDFHAELGMGMVLGPTNVYWPRFQICNSLAASKAIARQRIFRPASQAVVRNGLDISQFPFYRSLPEVVHILSVGRLCQVKRWDRLLIALASLENQGIRFEASLAGEGALRHELEKQSEKLKINGKIKFLGFQPDVNQLLRQSTFLVHTAEHEGTPNAIMEAMACGRAVVAIEAGDVPALVEDGINGFLVPRGNQKKLEECIKTLAQSPDLCLRMGEAGRTKAEKDFCVQRLVEDTLDTYRARGWRDS